MTPEEVQAADDLLHTLDRLTSGVNAAIEQARNAGLSHTREELWELRHTLDGIFGRTATGLLAQ